MTPFQLKFGQSVFNDTKRLADALRTAPVETILPMDYCRALFNGAARGGAPLNMAPLIEARLAELPKIPGRTVLLFDTSGSMFYRSSMGSDTFACQPVDLGATMAMVLAATCETFTIYISSGTDGISQHRTVLWEGPRQGFALAAALRNTRGYCGIGGIFATQALAWLDRELPTAPDRIVMISDDEDTYNADEPEEPPKPRTYLLKLLDVPPRFSFWSAAAVGYKSDPHRLITEYEAIRPLFAREFGPLTAAGSDLRT